MCTPSNDWATSFIYVPKQSWWNVGYYDTCTILWYTKIVFCKICMWKQSNVAHPPKFAQFHLYRKRQLGAVLFVSNLKHFSSKSIHMTKEDCSSLSLSVEMVLSELKRVSGVCLVYYIIIGFVLPRHNFQVLVFILFCESYRLYISIEATFGLSNRGTWEEA